MGQLPLQICTALFLSLLACAPDSAYKPLNTTRSQQVVEALDTISLRFVNGDAGTSLSEILTLINSKVSAHFNESQFYLTENRVLANHRYMRFVQLKAGIPIAKRSIRVWIDLKTSQSHQVEALLENIDSAHSHTFEEIVSFDESSETEDVAKAKKIVGGGKIKSIRTERQWHNQKLVRQVVIKNTVGIYEYYFQNGKLVSQEFNHYPDSGRREYTLPAKIYPMWEFSGSEENNPTQRVNAKLKYLSTSVKTAPLSNMYSPINEAELRYSKYSEDKGSTPAGIANGFWSFDYLRNELNKVYNSMKDVSNLPTSGKARLSGRYTTVYLHPNAPLSFEGLQFTPETSPQHSVGFSELPNDDAKINVSTLPYGLPISSIVDLANRIALPVNNLPDNDPVQLINNGFDEVQVYYAINALFDSLKPMGFTDQDLSTRPFTAILFDPNIEYRDNAYYDSDTINFTTYSKGQLNYARDNTTIWHELGHGIMDRLMGSHLKFADSGGLAEGMADFIAQLVVMERTNGQDFPGRNQMRIFNKTGFHLTNESHDDGEAYGGAMQDMLLASIQKFGFADGLKRMGDLTLEAMRLTRDHPGITAEAWFERMVFADSLERSLELAGAPRIPGEMREVILDALKGRNFSIETSDVYATITLKNETSEILDKNLGSRRSPIPVQLREDETKTFALNLKLNDGNLFQFKYPARVRVGFEGGPLQGAIRWVNQENLFTEYLIHSPGELLQISVTLKGVCDSVNKEDGSCTDFIYVQVFQHGEPTDGYPVAKKRFYTNMKPVSFDTSNDFESHSTP